MESNVCNRVVLYAHGRGVDIVYLRVVHVTRENIVCTGLPAARMASCVARNVTRGRRVLSTV